LVNHSKRGAQVEDKDMFLQDLTNICENLDIPALVGGDFNILRFADEKNKGNVTSRFSDSFNVVIDLYNLREIPLSGGQFTWSNNQKNPTLKKLDKILINFEWENLFPLSSARKIPRLMSNHNPIILDTHEKIEPKSKKFRFEKSWIKHPEFLTRVEKDWNNPVRGIDSISIVQKNEKSEAFSQRLGCKS
jgi:hypothetical protein